MTAVLCRALVLALCSEMRLQIIAAIIVLAMYDACVLHFLVSRKAVMLVNILKVSLTCIFYQIDKIKLIKKVKKLLKNNFFSLQS